MIKPHSSFVAGNKVVIINDSGFAIVSEFYRNDVVLRFVDTRVGVSVLKVRSGTVILVRQGAVQQLMGVFDEVLKVHGIQMKYLVDIQLCSEGPGLCWGDIESQYLDARMKQIKRNVVVKFDYFFA